MAKVRTAEVRAAGGVVWRRRDGEEIEVALIHRPRYDDWSLPKGKLEAGESWKDAALREVEEEIGLRCKLGPELPTVRYVEHRGRPKRVRYWLMQEGVGSFEPNDEVDELRWVGAAAAPAILTYAYDAALVARAAELLTQ